MGRVTTTLPKMGGGFASDGPTVCVNNAPYLRKESTIPKRLLEKDDEVIILDSDIRDQEDDNTML